MDGIDVVMLIAIILFARLGIRLLGGYHKMKNNKKRDSEKEDP